MDDNDSVIAVTEENQDELSVIDDFSLVSHKRCRKPNKKYGYSSPTRKKDIKSNREVLYKGKGGGSQRISETSKKPLSTKNKKRSIMKGLIWNCRGMKKKGVSSFLRSLILEHKFHFIGIH